MEGWGLWVLRWEIDFDCACVECVRACVRSCASGMIPQWQGSAGRICGRPSSRPSVLHRKLKSRSPPTEPSCFKKRGKAIVVVPAGRLKVALNLVFFVGFAGAAPMRFVTVPALVPWCGSSRRPHRGVPVSPVDPYESLHMSPCESF